MTRDELYREIGPYIVRASLHEKFGRVSIVLADYGFTVKFRAGDKGFAASAVPSGWDAAKADRAFEHAISLAGGGHVTWLTEQLPAGPWHDDPQAQG